jgi:hypothetical protein
MDKSRFTADLRNALFRSVTGRAGDVSGRADADVRGMLTAAYGPGPRGAAINTRAAAQDLGVRQRTVQRWLAGDERQHNRPSDTHLRGLARKARQAATTRAGRRRALAGVRGSSMTRYGSKMAVRGVQGPTAAGRDYRRSRQVLLQLDPDSVTDLLDAYEAGGDKGLVSWLEEYAGDHYVDGWGFDSIEHLGLDDPRG